MDCRDVAVQGPQQQGAEHQLVARRYQVLSVNAAPTQPAKILERVPIPLQHLRIPLLAGQGVEKFPSPERKLSLSKGAGACDYCRNTYAVDVQDHIGGRGRRGVRVARVDDAPGARERTQGGWCVHGLMVGGEQWGSSMEHSHMLKLRATEL